MERERYHTAEGTPYLVRNRIQPPQNWFVDPESFSASKSGIKAKIIDSTNKKDLELCVDLIPRGVHITVKPQTPENFKRFDCSAEPSIVDQKILKSGRECVSKLEGGKILINKEVEITLKPFKVTFFDEKGAAMIANFDDAAIFEHNRDPSSEPQLFEPSEYNGFKDEPRNGPTSVAMSFRFNGKNVRLSGLPSHTLPLTLPDTTKRDPIRFYNTDMNHFGLDETMSMYGAIPFVFAHSSDRFQGLFWSNASESWADIKHGNDECDARFVAEGGFIDFFVFTETTPYAIADDFTTLTGRPMFQPRFTLAYHQCKWGYKDQEMFEGASKSLDDYGVPHDVMWADIDHTEGKKYWAFDPKTYPHPERIIEKFEECGRKLVTIVDPHIKVEKGFSVYDEAHAQGLAIKQSDGKTDYEGECWPGNSIWADFLNPATHDWWASKYSFDHFKQSAENVYIWNDMNEISVFGGPEGSCPRTLMHYGGYEEREVHNIYGHLMTSATYNGLRRRTMSCESREVSGKPMRPFVLTRSFFAGSQKYSGCWGGDNQSTYGYLKGSLQMVLSYGICGMIFTGSDIGGFFDTPDDKLLSRWHQAGAWMYPFFRNHAIIDVPQREIPIMKDEKLKQLAKDAVIERYRILPYWYTVYRSSCRDGLPIVRPMWMEFNDEELIDADEYAMIGEQLLVVPFLDEEEKDVKFTMPKGFKWFNYRTLQEHKEGVAKYDEGRTLVLIKEGSIIPKKSETKPVEKTSQLMNKYPIELIVALDGNKEAHGEYYDDDGLSEEYVNGEFLDVHYTMKANKLTAEIVNKENNFANKECNGIVIDTIKIAGYNEKPSEIKLNGDNVSFQYQNNVIIINEQIPINKEFEILIQ